MKPAIFCIALFPLALSACGGGGSSASASAGAAVVVPVVTAPAPTVAEGLYQGKSSDNRTVTGLVLDDGSYYFIYTRVNNAAVIGGAVSGNGVSTNGSFASTNGIDINLEGSGALPVAVSASYVAATSLSGNLNYTAQNFASTFTSIYSKDYLTAPSLATVAGTYSGAAASISTSEQTSFVISATGAISGSSVSGCRFTGTITPRSKGNVYSVAVTFGGPPCLLGTSAFSGAAYYDASTKNLYSVALNSARNNGYIYSGVKQ
jgi:hypothetical protein